MAIAKQVVAYMLEACLSHLLSVELTSEIGSNLKLSTWTDIEMLLSCLQIVAYRPALCTHS